MGRVLTCGPADRALPADRPTRRTEAYRAPGARRRRARSCRGTLADAAAQL